MSNKKLILVVPIVFIAICFGLGGYWEVWGKAYSDPQPAETEARTNVSEGTITPDALFVERELQANITSSTASMAEEGTVPKNDTFSKFVENFSIEGGKTMKSQESVANQTELPKTNEMVYLKYNKKF